jgi:hypothetical protein
VTAATGGLHRASRGLPVVTPDDDVDAVEGVTGLVAVRGDAWAFCRVRRGGCGVLVNLV